MQTKFLWFATLAALVAAVFAAPSIQAASNRRAAALPAAQCDRACLDGFVDQYLGAVVAHDPSRLPVSSGVKFTENTASLKLGEGTWGTINGLGTFKLHFDDVAMGQAGFIGVVKEWDNPVIMCLRLKVADGKITEVEDFIARDANAAKSLDAMGQPNPLFETAIPAAERATREELIKTANLYFTGLQNNDGKGVYPFTDDCNRIENGTQTTNNRARYEKDPSTGNMIMSLGCAAQFKTGYFKIVTRIRDRRFVIVDPERGLAFAFGFFDHAGTVKSITLTDGTWLPTTLRHPFTWEIGELFKIENGKIRFIQAALTQEPYGLKPGWPAKTTPAVSRMGGAPAGDCDRQCLNTLVDAYRAAVIEHDASRLPLTKDARYTENAQDLKFNDGLWGTLTGWGDYKLYIDDPEDGEVAYVGITDEAGMSGLIVVRLRVANKKISEIEALITRKETPQGFTRPEGFLEPRPQMAKFFQDVPESERGSNKGLIATTDLYFDGIEQSKGSIVPFASDVIRVENGTQTCPSSFGPAAAKSGPPPSCSAQLDTRIFSYIFPIKPRRYTVVDRQRGIVLGIFMFNTPGTVKSVDVPGVGKVDESAAALRPFSEVVAEFFKINNGKIDTVAAVMTGLPFGDTSGWSGTLQ
jgi:hypothetical protein